MLRAVGLFFAVVLSSIFILGFASPTMVSVLTSSYTIKEKEDSSYKSWYKRHSLKIQAQQIEFMDEHLRVGHMEFTPRLEHVLNEFKDIAEEDLGRSTRDSQLVDLDKI